LKQKIVVRKNFNDKIILKDVEVVSPSGELLSFFTEYVYCQCQGMKGQNHPMFSQTERHYIFEYIRV
jgi:hypothetical protein